MVCETLTDLQQHVAELLEIDSVTHVNLFINELKSYGIDDVEKLEDAYFGCYPTVEKFAEDFCVDVYHDEMEKLPAWVEDAIDWELVWHQTLRYDFFEITFDGYTYFFNNNF
jgi:hypothetical protein